MQNKLESRKMRQNSPDDNGGQNMAKKQKEKLDMSTRYPRYMDGVFKGREEEQTMAFRGIAPPSITFYEAIGQGIKRKILKAKRLFLTVPCLLYYT